MAERRDRLDGPPRRLVLTGVLAVGASVVAACSSDPASPGSSPTSSAPPPPSPTSSSATPAPAPPAPPPTLAPAAAWAPGPGEIQPEVKAAATAFVESVGSWGDGQGSVEAVAGRVAALGLPAEVAGPAAVLAAPDSTAAALQVVYPQYGGLTTDLSSVMTHVRQQLLAPDGTTTTRDLTLDVRLSRAPAGWRVSTIVLAPAVAPAPALSAVAQQALATPNLRLPEAARADVGTGLVDDRLLAILVELAGAHVLDVQVLTTGHPVNVFETDRVSNHTGGRAADVWRIDDLAVVDPATPRDLLVEVMTAAGALGATEVGGPFDLNGDGPGYFTDLTHRDHLHFGITEDRPPADPTRTTR